MPELPEVETIRRQLAPAVEGRRLERIRVLDPRWSEPAPPEAIADALDGRRIERMWRRGKYLVMSLEDDVHLVMHLRMTGNILLTAEEPKHTRVIGCRGNWLQVEADGVPAWTRSFCTNERTTCS